MPQFKTIRVESQNDFAQIVLQHPPSNIIDFQVISELSAAFQAVKESKFLKLSSSLPNFSTGVDIKIHTPDHVERMLRDFHAICRQLYSFEGTTLAVLNGFALGGGMELALLCDFIFATSDTALGFPEITLACFPPVAAVLLPHLIGRRAYRLMYTGEIVSAADARKLGLIDEVFESSDTEQLYALLEKLRSYSPHALRTLKKAIKTSAAFDFDKKLKRAEQLYLSQLKDHPNTLEGINAFLEKRKPKF